MSARRRLPIDVSDENRPPTPRRRNNDSMVHTPSKRTRGAMPRLSLGRSCKINTSDSIEFEHATRIVDAVEELAEHTSTQPNSEMKAAVEVMIQAPTSDFNSIMDENDLRELSDDDDDDVAQIEIDPMPHSSSVSLRIFRRPRLKER